MEPVKNELKKEIRKFVLLWINGKVDTESFISLLSLPCQIKQEISQVLHMANANYTIAQSYPQTDEETLEAMEAVLEDATHNIIALSLKKL